MYIRGQLNIENIAVKALHGEIRADMQVTKQLPHVESPLVYRLKTNIHDSVPTNINRYSKTESPEAGLAIKLYGTPYENHELEKLPFQLNSGEAKQPAKVLSFIYDYFR